MSNNDLNNENQYFLVAESREINDGVILLEIWLVGSFMATYVVEGSYWQWKRK